MTLLDVFWIWLTGWFLVCIFGCYIASEENPKDSNGLLPAELTALPFVFGGLIWPIFLVCWVSSTSFI
jgi:hypothetical protein